MLLTEEEKKSRWEAAYAGERHVPKNMHRATSGMFWEYRHQNRAKERGLVPLFNLSLRDHDDTLSFPQLYFQCSSEYEAAMVILGSWEHWERLCATTWFKEKLDKWREEKTLRDMAHGQAKIRELADKGNLSAAKLLATGGVQSPDKVTRKTKAKKNEPEVESPQLEPSVEDDEWLAHGLDVMENESGD